MEEVLSGLSAEAVRDDITGSSGAKLSDVFDRFLLQPLNKAIQDADSRPIVVLLDALDEMKPGPDRRALLALLGSHFSRLSGQVRFILTSRPEADIVEALRAMEVLQLDEAELKGHQETDMKLVLKRRIVVQIRGGSVCT